MSLSIQSLTYIISLVTIISSTIYICFSLISMFKKAPSVQLFLSLIKSRNKPDKKMNLENRIIFTKVENVIKINMLSLDMKDETTIDSKEISKVICKKGNI